MNKNILIPVLIATLSIAGCKKYEDGPLISFKSKKARLSRFWTNNDNPNVNTYEFRKNGYFTLTTTNSNYTIIRAGTWEFDSKKENIHVDWNSNNISGTYDWEIKRLTSKEFWFSYDVNGYTNETRLVPY